MLGYFTPTYNTAPSFTYSDASTNQMVSTQTSSANFVFLAQDVVAGVTVGQFEMQTEVIRVNAPAPPNSVTTLTFTVSINYCTA